MTRIDIEIPVEAADGRHGVYVLTDAEGGVLYIGRTMRLFSRLTAHRNAKAWWPTVRGLEWVACDGPNEARLVEKEFIGLYRPGNNSLDYKMPKGSRRQQLPDWTAAKLVELHEATIGHRGESDENTALNIYIAALREAGWTLAALSLPLSMSREAVRIRQAAAPTTRTTLGVPRPPAKAKPAKKVRPQIPPDALRVMKALHADARQVRGWTPVDSPLREASVRLTELIAEHHLAGVSIYRIAKQLEVTHLAIRARLARHGYMEPVKGLDQPDYGTPFTLGRDLSHCMRGHEFSGDNLLLINGDPKRRVCRACNRIRAQKHKAKRKAIA